jgi:hypothetical protein
MGYVATHLLWGDVAWRLNVLSAVWGALAVGAAFIFIFDLSSYIIAFAHDRARRKVPTQARQTNAARRREQTRSKASRATVKALPTEPLAAARALQEDTSSTWLILLAASAGASLLAASASFWSRTAQAKMYSLHFFLVFALFLLALNCRRAQERGDASAARRWFIALAATLGLSFTNHLMTVLLVLPLAMLLVLGPGFSDRLRFFVRRLPLAAVAFGLPLLLYLYMPLRSAQHPIMNWGSPDNWGDFWRQVSGWQFRPFLLGNLGENLQRNLDLISGYFWAQWGFLTLLVVLGGLAGLALLARVNLPLFAATGTFALLTVIFALFYGISEIEPYMVPFYAMLAVWIGLAPACLLAFQAQRDPRQPRVPSPVPIDRLVWLTAGLAALVAVVSAVLVYPTQNYSNNRLAEQFATNVLDELPQNSILITDYWDFYSPTYYLQLIKNVRPDITLVDKSLLRYPFYTQQLRQRYPWLIEKSQDIVSTFSVEQRKWVNGEVFNQPLLNSSYFDLMTSFIERNKADHPAFLLSLEQCVTGVPQSCEANQIAPDWIRQPFGLTTRLLPSQPTGGDLPPEPDYRLEGILSNPVALDSTAKINSSLYVDAYQRLAILYSTAGQSDKAQEMDNRASAIAAALESR